MCWNPGNLRRYLTNSVWPIIILAAVLRLVGLGRLCLWYDEAFTAWLARLPVPQLLAATAGDVHPPTWYILTKDFTTLLGSSSEWALRLPAALFGILNVWLTWKVARAWGLNPRAVWLAALLMAIAPLNIHYSQEARMYSLLTTGVLLMAWGVGRWEPGSFRNWLAFVGGGALALWSHNLGLFYVLALCLAVVAREWRLDRAAGMTTRYWFHQRAWGIAWPLAIRGLGMLALWAPWLWVMVTRQMSHVAQGFWIQRPSVGTWLAGWNFLVWGHATYQWAMFAAVPAALLLVVMAVYVGCRARRWDLLAWLLGPGLLMMAVSWLWRPIWLERGLVPLVPALALLLAMALDGWPTARWVSIPVAPLLLAWLLLLHTAPVKLHVGPFKHPIDEYAAIIEKGWQPGDLVFHGNLASYVLFDYYLPDGMPNAVWRQANDLSQSLTDESKVAMGMNQIDVGALAGYRRLWVVWSETPMSSPAEEAVIGGMIRTWPSQVVATIEDTPSVTAKIYLVTLERDETDFHPSRGETGFHPVTGAKGKFIRW